MGTLLSDLKLMGIPFFIYLCFLLTFFFLAFITMVFSNDFFSVKAGPSGNLSIASAGNAGLKSGASLFFANSMTRPRQWIGNSTRDHF